MTDQRLENEIKAIESKYIDKKKTFTAVDIGNELKRKDINARQRQVSPIVREHFKGDLYNEAEYTRTLIPVKSGNAQTYLYFHIDNAPEDYTETDQIILPWDPTQPMFPNNGDNDSDGAVKAASSLDDVVDSDEDSNNGNNNLGLDDYIGSKNSKVYHSPDCMYVVRINNENIVSFSDVKDATKDGYRKCMRE